MTEKERKRLQHALEELYADVPGIRVTVKAKGAETMVRLTRSVERLWNKYEKGSAAFERISRQLEDDLGDWSRMG